jgi:hypothetical protein
MKHVYMAFAVASVLTAAQLALADDTSAKYTVTFDGTWSAATHPIEYPSNAHFSGLIGATHDAGYVLFREGRTATDGLEKLAEMGAHSPLDKEIRAAIDKGVAGALIESDPLFDLPALTSVTFTIDPKHPMVSFVAMIAPSPDWFAGAADMSLRENGAWVSRKEVTLYAWDAGTDNGTTYKADDADTQPRAAVSPNRSAHFVTSGSAIPVGKLVFEKLGEMPAKLSQR